MMDMLDSAIRERKYGEVHMISDKSFARYKEWMREEVERKAAGQSEASKKRLIMNIITHQKRYAFGGEQMQQLLNLAKVEGEEREASGF